MNEYNKNSKKKNSSNNNEMKKKNRRLKLTDFYSMDELVIHFSQYSLWFRHKKKQITIRKHSWTDI